MPVSEITETNAKLSSTCMQMLAPEWIGRREAHQLRPGTFRGSSQDGYNGDIPNLVHAQQLARENTWHHRNSLLAAWVASASTSTLEAAEGSLAS